MKLFTVTCRQMKRMHLRSVLGYCKWWKPRVPEIGQSNGQDDEEDDDVLYEEVQPFSKCGTAAWFTAKGCHALPRTVRVLSQDEMDDTYFTRDEERCRVAKQEFCAVLVDMCPIF